MKYKLLVSDLDETLLNDDGSIHEENVAAIKKATAQGMKFVPNTGRSFKSVQELLKTLDLFNRAGQYVISYNGAAIIENKDNQVLDTQELPRDLALKIIETVLQLNAKLDAHIYTVDTLFIYQLTETDKRYMAERGVPYNQIIEPNWQFLATEQPIMKVIFEALTQEEREQVKAAVLAVVGPDQVEVTFSSGRYVEFNRAGVDKGSASLRLGSKLGLTAAEIIAVGDNNNDLKMIEAAGLGVSVANGIPAVQAVADVITKRTNNEGAVAEIIQEFVFGKE